MSIDSIHLHYNFGLGLGVGSIGRLGGCAKPAAPFFEGGIVAYPHGLPYSLNQSALDAFRREDNVVTDTCQMPPSDDLDGDKAEHRRRRVGLPTPPHAVLVASINRKPRVPRRKAAKTDKTAATVKPALEHGSLDYDNWQPPAKLSAAVSNAFDLFDVPVNVAAGVKRRRPANEHVEEPGRLHKVARDFYSTHHHLKLGYLSVMAMGK